MIMKNSRDLGYNTENVEEGNDKTFLSLARLLNTEKITIDTNYYIFRITSIPDHAYNRDRMRHKSVTYFDKRT